jgi:CelD/BcsL family acetyltransferase involved in cellulose biosynthesis
MSELDLQVRITGMPAGDQLASMWQALERECDASFFQSWAWIGTWLDCLPDFVRPELVIMEAGGGVVGLGVIVPRSVRRHGVFRSHALYLQEAGAGPWDFIIEHNGFLLRRGMERELLAEVLRALHERQSWDEFVVSGIRADSLLLDPAALQNVGLQARIQRTSPSRYVDLDELRASGVAYLDRLSSNTRYQIRRAIRKYQEQGPVAMEVAESAADAQRYFDELKALHQAYWIARGHRGSFANPAWEQFHRTLIERRFGHGEIQLIQVHAGERLIGCLYNFVKDGWVSVLQSGFQYESNHALHPGLVSHYLAIEHNLAQGQRWYDFLAGDGQYKSSMADKDHALVWAVLQRPRVKFQLEDGLRSLRNALYKHLSRPKAPHAPGSPGSGSGTAT